MAPRRAVASTLTSTLRLALRSSPPTHISSTIQRRSISAYGYEQAKALVLSSYGEPKDVLRLHSHSISPPTGDLVTVKFLAAPLNPADINQIQGVYPTKPTFTTSLSTPDPIAVAGNEGVAQVVSTGGNVKHLSKGDWVIMKKQGLGTWRSHAQTPAENLIPIKNKDNLTPEQVGTVSVNPMTAYRMLKDFMPLQPGDWFIQNASNSGVGRAAIQLAKLWGYKSINVVRSRSDASAQESLVSDLKSLGADVVVTEDELNARDFRDKLASLTNKSSPKLALNCVGGALVNSMAKHLAPSSPVVTYGAMAKQPVNLPMGLLIFKDIQFKGFWVSKWSDANPEEKEKCVEEVLEWTRQGKFKDMPTERIEWTRKTGQEELVKAVQGTLEGYRSGKGIFVFGDD